MRRPPSTVSPSGTSLRHYRRLARWLPFHHLDEKLSSLFFFALMLPVLTLAACVLVWTQLSAGIALIPVLLASLTAAGLALWGTQQLLAPLRMAQLALRAHADSGRVQPLPTDLRDDLGGMLSDLRKALETGEARGQAVQALSFDDALTGLPNARFATEYLRMAVYAAERSSLKLSVALIDPEHIGRINERHGVEAGDRAIRRVGDFLRHWLKRKSDWIGRWQGDQFIAVMFCDQHSATDFLANLRREFARQPQDFADSELAVNLGIVELHPRETLAEFTIRLESELLQAKQPMADSPAPPGSAKIFSIASALRKIPR